MPTNPSPAAPLDSSASNGGVRPPPAARAPSPDPVSSLPAEEGGDTGAVVPLLPDAPRGSLLWRLGGFVRTMRPHQWLKNAFVLAPVFFAKDIFELPLITHALAAFFVFCLLAGAVYTMNDIVDVEGDRVHPVKRHRPIASGRVPLPAARALTLGLVLVSLGGAVLLNPWFALVAAGYFVENVAYSLKLKKVAYLDVSCISAGFVLRVLAGGLATHIKVSGYLFVCTALLALFLGFGKRRHELAQAQAKKQREVLEAYKPGALNAALAVTSALTVATYLAYTLDPQTRLFFHSDYLWLSTVFTLFGMARFFQLVTSRPKAESPTQEMLRDVPFILNLVAWVFWVLVTVYQLRPAGAS